MPQEPDFDRIYRLLDVDPTEGWEAVQQSYRRKAQAFHPDRAGGNPRIEKIAKIRFEELNESFEELRRFRRIFGDLPPKGLKRTLQRTQGPPDTNFITPLPDQRPTSSPIKWVISLGAVIILAALAIIGFTPG